MGIVDISIIGGERIAVKSPFSFKEILQSIPGAKWENTNKLKAWSYPLTPFSAHNIASSIDLARFGFSRENLPIELVNCLDDYLQIEIAQKFKPESFVLPPHPVAWKTFYPYNHQTRSLFFTEKLKSSLLWLGMGAGKSRIASDLIALRGHKKILVSCLKKAVDSVWPFQFSSHAIYPYVISAVKNGSVADKLHSAMDAISLAKKLNRIAIVVVNHDSIWRGDFGEWVKDEDFDFLVVDECHRLAGSGSNVSKFFQSLRHIPFKVGLSGTPLPDKPMDAYGVMRFLDEGIFGTSVKKFQSKYCIMGGFNNYQYLGMNQFTKNEYMDRLFSIILIVRDEKLDLPELCDPQDYLFNLPKDVRRFYNELREEFISYIGDEEFSFNNALEKLTKLHQVANGFYIRNIQDPNSTINDPSFIKTISLIHDEKIEILAEILESIDSSEPIPIFYHFTQDSQSILEASKRAGRTCGVVSGSRDDLMAWQAGKFDNLAIQLKSGSDSIDLTRASIFGHYSQNFSLTNYKQSIKRVHRPPQKKPVRRFRILARNTVDIDVARKLELKEEVLESLFKEGLALWE